MTFKSLAAATCVAAVALSAGSSAFAQAAPASAPVAQGPAIPGLCIMSMEVAIGGSTVGKYVDTRLGQITAQVNAELNGEKTSLDTDAKALDGQRATLDQNSFEQRASALQVRANALQRKAQQREREVQATEQKALGRISSEMEPLIKQAYQTNHCSVLLQRQAVLLGNPSFDITGTVVTALNAKITQFPFDREHLDSGATPGAAPAVIQTPARPATKK
jgi:Skp family chaperone for outer membrane proteins